MDAGHAETDSTEVEWQFDALDLRPVERWLAALPSPPGRPDVPQLTALAKPHRRLVDRYMDTDDWRIGRAGYTLRTRMRGHTLEATIKDVRPAEEGLRRRLEVTEALPADGLEAIGDGGPVGRRVSAVAGRRPLVQVLEVRTRRRPFSLRAGGTEVAEVALDETTIVVGSGERPASLRRVEVEVVAEWVDALRPVVDELKNAAGLRPATLSKYEAGLLTAGIEIPGPPELGPTDVGPSSTFGDLAYAVVRRHLGVLLAREPGTRLGEDIEELHDMRVATRRLRAAIELFHDVLPSGAETLRSELAWLAGALGAVRDLDVQLEGMDQLDEWVEALPHGDQGRPLDDLRALLEGERNSARRLLLDALDSERWDELAERLTAMARQGPDRELPAADVPAVAVVPDLVASRHRAVVKAARRAHRTRLAADYHRVRIRCKRLRYSVEFTASVYGGPAQKFIRKMAVLQDALGAMNDAEVGSARLYDLATGSTLPQATVFMMGAIAAHYRTEAEKLRASMARRLGAVRGGAWQQLAARMERDRAAAAARKAEADDTAGATAAAAHGATASEPAPPAPDRDGDTGEASDGAVHPDEAGTAGADEAGTAGAFDVPGAPVLADSTAANGTGGGDEDGAATERSDEAERSD